MRSTLSQVVDQVESTGALPGVCGWLMPAAAPASRTRVIPLSHAGRVVCACCGQCADPGSRTGSTLHTCEGCRHRHTDTHPGFMASSVCSRAGPTAHPCGLDGPIDCSAAAGCWQGAGTLCDRLLVMLCTPHHMHVQQGPCTCALMLLTIVACVFVWAT